jgi:hypothetical protein
MAKLAKHGWMIAATIHEGPSEFAVRCFRVGADTEAEAISAVRRLSDIDPKDVIVLHRELSQSEIETNQLANGAIQVLPSSAAAAFVNS